MNITRKNAMAFWAQKYGRQCNKTKDFAGRQIEKGAYNTPESRFCWSIDHIKPQSLDGGSAKENLQITHCKTNQEKGDNFPTFKANNINFQIVKKSNGIYQVEVLKSLKDKFLDANVGLDYLKKLESKESKTRWIGSVLVHLQNVSKPEVIEFIVKILGEDSIPYSLNKGNNDIYIAKNYNCSLKDDVSNLLDKCILLNTYLG